MAGNGLTNYNVDKPTYAFSTATTEFDDELMRRGIASMEQAMMRKGASAAEAQRLAAETSDGQGGSQENPAPEAPNDDGSSDDDFDDDDDGFLQSYRAKRMQEMKQEHAANAATPSNQFGEVIPIQRPEWTHHVNDASQDFWVVVTLTSNRVEITGNMEQAVAVLAKMAPSVKFVTIPSTSAIANWPDSNLPSMFLYREGKMTKEFVQMKLTMSPLQLMEELASCGVDFESEEVQSVKKYDAQMEESQQYRLRRQLMLADEEDDDEVI